MTRVKPWVTRISLGLRKLVGMQRVSSGRHTPSKRLTMPQVIVEHRTQAPAPLTGSALKVTVVLDAAQVLALPPPPNGQPRTTLRIAVAGCIVTADIASKSLRKCQATIHEAGLDGAVAVIIQGKLVDNTIAEAGLVAQPKLAKPTEAPAVG